MGSYEIIVKTEEIKKKKMEGDYEAAQKILDTIDLRKVKNITDLSLMADVLTENGRDDEALELLLRIYNKARTRKVLNQLVLNSIKRINLEDAESYLKEFEEVAPNDFYRYIFRFNIDKLKGESFETQISSLKALKETEYIEKWAYELAKLYYKAGMEEDCIRECSDIILWFGEGSYVEKAKVLKSYYTGGSDKDKILDELKQRAVNKNSEESETEHIDNNYIKEDSDNTAEQPYNYEDSSEYASDNEDSSEYVGDNEDSSEYDREDNYDEEPYTVEISDDEETERLTDNIKKDVEGILSEESYGISNTEYNTREYNRNNTFDFGNEAYGSSNYSSKAYNTKDYRKDSLQDEYNEEDLWRASKEDTNLVVENAYPVSQGEQSEMYEDSFQYEEVPKEEVPEEEVPEEEEPDEEDRRLKKIGENLGIDMFEIFGGFLKVSSLKKQIVKSLEIILDRRTKSVQMIITGNAGSGKTALAKGMAIFLNKVGKLKTQRVAKINAEKLNTIDLMTKKETLVDCCLLIENANELKRPTIDKLLELIKFFHGDMAVIFEENNKNMNKLFRECPKLMDLFKNRIHLPNYTEEELFKFAYSMIKLKDYKLKQGALNTLKNEVNRIIKSAESDRQLEAIQKLVQSAMKAADLRAGRQLPGLAATGRLADIEILTITAGDIIGRNNEAL